VKLDRRKFLACMGAASGGLYTLGAHSIGPSNRVRLPETIYGEKRPRRPPGSQ
jgi:hypothetical protein